MVGRHVQNLGLKVEGFLLGCYGFRVQIKGCWSWFGLEGLGLTISG